MSTTAPDQRITSYQPTVATTQFAAMFPVFDNDDIAVYHNGVERTDFTVSATYDAGVATDARAVFETGIVGKVLIVGARDPRRTNQFNPGGPLPTRDLNLAINTTTAELQEARRDINRALKAPFGVEAPVIPEPGVKQVIGWDESGVLTNIDPAEFVEDAGFATAAQGAKADTSLQKADNYVSRGGNYLGVGQPADLDGLGKGGILLGGGHPDRGQGCFLTLDGMPNWPSIVPGRNYQPQEFIIYGSSGQGYARGVPGTNQITRVWGSTFDPFWEGKAFYFLRKRFRVIDVVNDNTLTVSEEDGAAVSFLSDEIEAFNFQYTIGEGTLDIVGDRLHWRSGTPFVPLFFTDFHFYLNGTEVTVVEQISVKEYRLSAPPGNATDVPYYWIGNIFDQLTTLRVQAIQGAEEENVNIYTVAGQAFYGRYNAFRAGTAGHYAKSRPIYIGSGSYGPYLPRDQIGIYPDGGPGGAYGDGYVSLGGVQGLEALRVYNPPNMNTAKNRLEIPNTPAGLSPGIRSRGSDPNVGMYFDTQGDGPFTFTSGSYGRTSFRIYGSAGADHLCVDAANGQPYLGAEGDSANIDIRIIPKGAGRIRYGTFAASSDAPIIGSIEIKDAAGNVRKLAVIA